MAVERVVGKINEVPLLGSSAIYWTLRDGTKPVIHNYDIRNEDAAKLVGLQRNLPVTLTILTDKEPLVIENLWILSLVPSETPYYKRIQLADRRWMWQYAWVTRRFNMRRRVGLRRVSADDHNVLDENKTVIDAFWYAPYSLRSPNLAARGKWKANEVLYDVLAKLSEFERKFAGAAGTPRLDGRIGDKIEALPVEHVELDDRGDLALERALAYIPEAAIYIDRKGDPIIRSRIDGREKEMLLRLGGNIDTAFVGDGYLEFVGNERTRPREVHVLFTREVEVRFDFFEAAAAAGIHDTVVLGTPPAAEARIMDNVIPVPDFKMVLADGNEVVQGTWVTIDEALESQSWANPPGIGGSKLTHAFLQKAFVPFIDSWLPLALSGKLSPDNDWAARVAALQEHYRRTFRINRRWMDHLLALRPYRVATIDTTVGQRAPVQAYADYAVIATQRSRARNALSGESDALAVNVDGYPPGGRITPGTRGAPAKVSILDMDQGIVHVDYSVDPNRVYEMILPSKIDVANMPADNIRFGTKTPIGFNIVRDAYTGDNIPRLTSSHKIAMILTAIPAAPNTSAQLHRIVVKPEDVQSLVPGNIGSALGPPMEIRVRPGMETARVAWSDNEVQAIEAAFGMPIPIDDSTEEGQRLSDRLHKITINEGDLTDTRNGASLRAISKAVAARIYASSIDHWQGRKSHAMNPAVVPAGWLSEVVHEVGTDGVWKTHVQMPDIVPPLDLASFLDAGNRAVLFHNLEGSPQ